jgi:hypothetical protein
MLLVRPAAVNDVPLLLRFFCELGEYERQPNAVVIEKETLIKDGFGSQPQFRGLIAEWEGQATGYALFFKLEGSWNLPRAPPCTGSVSQPRYRKGATV